MEPIDTVVQAEAMTAHAEMPGVEYMGWYESLVPTPSQPDYVTRSIMIGGTSISAIPNPVRARKALVKAAA